MSLSPERNGSRICGTGLSERTHTAFSLINMLTQVMKDLDEIFSPKELSFVKLNITFFLLNWFYSFIFLLHGWLVTSCVGCADLCSGFYVALTVLVSILLCAVTEELRKHSWSGIPREVRPITWRLLSVRLWPSVLQKHIFLSI